MSGTIPSCLWSHATLKVLHLLGNGFGGSLSSLNSQSNLTILALGSNQLTGSIPVSFQVHNFQQLDLSINKFSGTLSGNVEISPSTTSFYVNVNRLSGKIPSSFYESLNVGVLNALEGNIFGCEQSDVPASDENHASYECGSVNMQNSLLAWFVGATSLAFIAGFTFSAKAVVTARPSVSVLTQYRVWSLLIGGPLSLVALCLVGMVGYLSFKLLSTADNEYVTHTEQYWWSPSVAFLHGWQTVLFLLLLVTMSSFMVPAFVLSTSREAAVIPQLSSDANKLRLHATATASATETAKAVILQCLVHLTNIGVVSLVNAFYILQAVNQLTGVHLLLVQTALSIFKLGWSMVAIPWMASVAFAARRSLPHIVFMLLFVFIGSPFASTFCESSSCFLYVLVRPSTISFSFSVPAMECSQPCVTKCNGIICVTTCQEVCAFSSEQNVSGSILPPWVYSYQCSSAVVTSYTPVLIVSYLISGVIIPLFTISSTVLSDNGVGAKSANLLPSAFHEKTLWLVTADTAAALLQQSTGLAQRFGAKIMAKLFLNITVLLTFGLASPLLAVVIAFEAMTYFGSSYFIVERFVRLCSEGNLDAHDVRETFVRSVHVGKYFLRECCYITMGFIGVFWSVFVFDMIGDVYGELAGGLATLFPILLPLTLCFITVRLLNRSESPSSLEQSLIRASDSVPNPVILPQSTLDKFAAHNL
jgi:hypothetical protein